VICVKRSDKEEKAPAGYHFIYVRWITRKGVRVYPPKGLKAWKLKVPNVRKAA
jgi:hypothetical protein